MALRLDAVLALDGRQFFGVMREAQNVGANFGEAFKAHIAGAFSVAALIEFTNKVLDLAGGLKDLSEQTGLSLTELQQLKYAFEEVGFADTDLTSAVTRLGKAVDEGLKGTGPAAEAFAKLGISMKDLRAASGSTAAVMLLVSDALQNMSRIEARGPLRELFGKSGERFLELLLKLRESTAKAPLVSDKDISNVDKLAKLVKQLTETRLVGAGISTLGQTIESPVNTIGTLFNPAQLGARLIANFVGSFVKKPDVPKFGEAPAEPGVPETTVSDNVFEARNKALERQQELEEKIFSFQLKGLGVSQQRTRLQEEFNKHLENAQAFGLNRVTQGEAKHELDAAAKIAEMMGQLPETKSRLHFQNELQQIGGYGGGNLDETNQKVRDNTAAAVTMLRRIEALLNRIESNTADGVLK